MRLQKFSQGEYTHGISTQIRGNKNITSTPEIPHAQGGANLVLF